MRYPAFKPSRIHRLALTPDEAATALGLTTANVLELIRNGEILTCSDVRRTKRILPINEIKKWIKDTAR